MEDTIILEKDGVEKEIYPLLEVEKEEKHFLIYTTTKEKEEMENQLYVGELIENELRPIKEELLENFETLLNEVIESIKKKNEENA